MLWIIWDRPPQPHRSTRSNVPGGLGRSVGRKQFRKLKKNSGRQIWSCRPGGGFLTWPFLGWVFVEIGMVFWNFLKWRWGFWKKKGVENHRKVLIIRCFFCFSRRFQTFSADVASCGVKTCHRCHRTQVPSWNMWFSCQQDIGSHSLGPISGMTPKCWKWVWLAANHGNCWYTVNLNPFHTT